MVLIRMFGLVPATLLLLPVALYFVFTARRGVRASLDYRRRIGWGGKGRLARFWGSFRHYFSFGQILLDRVAVLSRMGRRFRFRFQHAENMHAALRQRRGLVVLSAHCGNWEAAAHALTELDRTVHVVIYKPELDRARRHLEKLGSEKLRFIPANGSIEASLHIIEALGRDEIVAMHADRVLHPDERACLELPFLGAPARFPLGPHLVGLLSGSPVIHAFVMREGFERYRFFLFPPLQAETRGRAQRKRLLESWVRSYVARLERICRRYPLQWHNFYPFWSDREEAALVHLLRTGRRGA